MKLFGDLIFEYKKIIHFENFFGNNLLKSSVPILLFLVHQKKIEKTVMEAKKRI